MTAISVSIPGIPPWLLSEGISSAGIKVGAKTVAMLCADILLLSEQAATLQKQLQLAEIFLKKMLFTLKSVQRGTSTC